MFEKSEFQKPCFEVDRHAMQSGVLSSDTIECLSGLFREMVVWLCYAFLKAHP